MEREHWTVLSQMVSEVGGRWPSHPRDQCSTAAIARFRLDGHPQLPGPLGVQARQLGRPHPA